MRDSHATDRAPLSAAGRKRALRERDRASLWSGAVIDELTTSALVEALPGLIADDRPATLGLVLAELGRRGGVLVTHRPHPMGKGGRVPS